MDLPPIGEAHIEEPEGDLNAQPENDFEDMQLVEEDTLLEEKEEEAQIARGQFQLQCDRLIEGIVVSSREVNELIAVYNEINDNMLPLSLKLTLGLICSRLFRSLGDLDDTACELARLIELYSAPWDGRAEALRRLHAQYRRNCRLLNAAIRKLHIATANSEHFRSVRILNKWEQLFTVVTQARGVGRKWKFRMTALKNAASKGPEAVEAFMTSEIYREAVNAQRAALTGGEIQRIADSDLSTKQLETEVTREEVTEAVKDTGGDYDDEESEISDLDESKLSLTKALGKSPISQKSVRFTEGSDYDDNNVEDEYGDEVKAKEPIPTESIGCWTHEPEYEKRLVVRLFRPTALRIATGNKDGCYHLHPGPRNPRVLQTSRIFGLGVAASSSPDANDPVGDFVVDARTILPDDSEIELLVADKSVAAGTIDLKGLAASDPSPVTLPDNETPIPEDYPFAVRMTIPLYSTSLGASVRVTVGMIPVAIFGVRHQIYQVYDKAVMTDFLETPRVARVLTTDSPQTPAKSPASPKSPDHPKSDAAKKQTKKERVLSTSPLRKPASTTKQSSESKRQIHRVSVALSPVHWETEYSADLPDGSETEDELRRKLYEQHQYMTSIIRSAEIELQQHRQRQIECDHCSGRIPVYSDTHVTRSSYMNRNGGMSRNNTTVQGTPVPPVRYAPPDISVRDRPGDAMVTLPAIYMPSQLGHAYSAKASNYFHPISHSGRRVTQPPSMFAMEVPSEGAATPSTLNLFSMAVRDTEETATDQRLKFNKP